MTNDIVERLRGAAAKPNGWAILGADAATEAADEIESLRSRLADLEAERKATDDAYDELLAERALIVARAENAERALVEADERHSRYVKAVGELAGMAARMAEVELSRDSWKREAEDNAKLADDSAGYAWRLAEAEALIDDVDTLAVNNKTGCGTCSTIQNLTTAYLSRKEGET